VNYKKHDYFNKLPVRNKTSSDIFQKSTMLLKQLQEKHEEVKTMSAHPSSNLFAVMGTYDN
jgi:hypothetical protein